MVLDMKISPNNKDNTNTLTHFHYIALLIRNDCHVKTSHFIGQSHVLDVYYSLVCHASYSYKR